MSTKAKRPAKPAGLVGVEKQRAKPAAPAKNGGQAKAPAGQAPAANGGGAAPKGDFWKAMQGVAKPFVDQAKGLGQAALDKFQDGAKAVQDALNPPLNPQQKKAAQYMQKMLGPDKLGGNDRTFNHQDVDAVVKGLTDTGLKGIVARRVVANKLPQGLDAAGVVKDPTAKPDTAKRKISSGQLQSFDKASQVLQGNAGMLDKLGLKAVFPGGISQDAVTHMLEGKFGLPPGVQIVPAKNWPQP